MASIVIVKLALDLLHLPSRVRQARDEPLPAGVQDLIAIAAGDEAILLEAATATERPPAVVRGAANFYIEQILMAPGSDSYRVLGASPDMAAAELRRNMTLLVKWLHPDAGITHERHAFTSRVTAAWDDLKTPERRAQYDAELVSRQAKARAKQVRKRPPNTAAKSPAAPTKKPSPKRFIRIPMQQSLGGRQPGRLRRTLLYLLGLKHS